MHNWQENERNAELLESQLRAYRRFAKELRDDPEMQKRVGPELTASLLPYLDDKYAIFDEEPWR